MKLCIALLLSLFCLAFTAYAPEAQDKPAGESGETQNSTTLAAREQELAALLESARQMREAGELLKAAQLLNQAGQLQLKLNRPKDALATFQESLALARQVNDPATIVDALNGAGATHLHSGDWQTAKPLVEEAITISEQNNYPAGRAEGLLLLSDCENRTDRAQAINTANKALAQWQTIGNDRGIIRSHVSIATYRLAQNSLDEAAQSYETARSLAIKAGAKDLEAEALIYTGFIAARKGAWHDVTELMWAAEELVDAESDPTNMMRISNTVAEAYVETGWPEIALQKYEESLGYASKTQDPRNLTLVKWGIGRILLFLRRHDDALRTLEEALQDSIPLKEVAVTGMCHEFLGRTYAAKNDPVRALEHLQTALNLYPDSENPMEAARTRGLIGQVYENTQQLAEARTFYKQALDIFERHADRVNQSAILFALGRLEMKSGEYETAENYLRRSIDVTENMRRMSMSRDLTAAFSATLHDRYQQYIQCLMRNHREPAAMSRVIQAFETSESARARSLVELLRVTNTNLLSHVDPELAKQEKALRQSLRVKEDDQVALLRKKHKEDELKKLDAELKRLEAQYNNVLATINERHPAYKQITQPENWDLRRIQEEVINDDDTLLLEFLLAPDRSYVWAVTRSGITSHELPSQERITKAAEKVYGLLTKAGTESAKALDQAREDLADMILSPVADQLHKQRIIVAADGYLHYIPFQILPALPNANPLVDEHTIVYAPSASILGELGKEAGQRGARPKVLAALGNPIFAEQKPNEQIASKRSIEILPDWIDPTRIGRLFYAGREIENLRKVASDEQTFVATEYDATRDQLLKLDLTQYAIVHFATHGALDTTHPERSGLLLSTTNRERQTVEGFVRLQDVYSLRAPVDLVVLSACETGLGQELRGEGLIGLTRGFMYAGATSVVASLWKVQDESTAELMKSFYIEMLQNGKTPAEALRLAQNSIRQRPQWSAPHYWAGFTLQGEYRYPVYSPAPSGWRAYQVVLLSSVLILLVATCVILIKAKATKRHKATQ